MSRYFVTELSESLPKILIATDLPEVGRQVAHQLASRGFTATVETFAHLSSGDYHHQFTNAKYYKIICLYNLAGNQVSPRVISQLFGKRREPILFVTRFDSTVDVDDNYTHEWYQLCKTQYRNIVALAEKFPRANLVIVRDLLLPGHPFHPAFNYFFHQVNSRVLSDPGLSFAFISQESFFFHIKPLLIGPYTGEKVLFTAEPIASEVLFTHLSNLTDHQYRIITTSYPPVDFTFPFPVVSRAGLSDLETLTSDYLESWLHFSQLPSRAGKRRLSMTTISAPSTPVASRSSRKVGADRSSANTSGRQTVKITAPVKITPPPAHPTSRQSKKTSASVYQLPPTASQKKQSPTKNTYQPIQNASQTITPGNAPSRPSPTLSKATRAAFPGVDRATRAAFSGVAKAPVTPKTAKKRILADTKKLLTTAPPTLGAYTTSIPTSQLGVGNDKFDFLRDVSGVRASRHQTLPGLIPDSPPPIIAVPSPSVSYPSQSSAIRRQTARPRNRQPVASYQAAKKPSLPLARHHSNQTISVNLSRRLKKTLYRLRRAWQQLCREVQEFDFSISNLRHQVTNHSRLALVATVAAIAAVGCFFYAYVPRQSYRETKQILINYLSACQDVESCFVTPLLPEANELELVRDRHLSPFFHSVSALSRQYNRFRSQLAAYYTLAWQKKTGDTGSALTSLSNTLAELTANLQQIQENLRLTSSEIRALVGGQQLDVFTEALDELEAVVSLYQANLPLLQNIAGRDEFRVSLVFLDDSVVRSGGGLIAGVGNLTFTSGRLSNAEFATTQDLADRSSVSVKTPELLTDLKTTNTDSLANLTFDHNFAETTELLAPVIDSALKFTPDLYLSVNLSTINDFKSNFSTLSGQDELTVNSLNKLTNQLTSLSADQAGEFLTFALQVLNDQRFQIVTKDSELLKLFVASGSDGATRDILCPAVGGSLCYLDSLVWRDNYLVDEASLAQKISHQITLQSDTTKHQRNVVFTNDNRVEGRDYFTLELPIGANLDKITLDGRPLTAEEKGGYLISVPARSKVTVSVEFSLERPITSSGFTYSFYHEYQNGLPEQQFSCTLNSEVSYRPTSIYSSSSAVSTGHYVISFGDTAQNNFLGAVIY